MNTMKRLILIEATLQRIEEYTGDINMIVPIHSLPHLINTLKDA